MRSILLTFACVAACVMFRPSSAFAGASNIPTFLVNPNDKMGYTSDVSMAVAPNVSLPQDNFTIADAFNPTRRGSDALATHHVSLIDNNLIASRIATANTIPDVQALAYDSDPDHLKLVADKPLGAIAPERLLCPGQTCWPIRCLPKRPT